MWRSEERCGGEVWRSEERCGGVRRGVESVEE